ncbi:hypothetical protein AAFF_G00296220 [Aldrovandia affinis]|uniref:Disks large-associated protein 5 n=1 Tax=Aldrovandia affinis TaxID=143900 RepID=A0AAD7WRG5_9TELE|nr:hypothetical protein AAFF_G00296220 [Aldrovandia affinis]
MISSTACSPFTKCLGAALRQVGIRFKYRRMETRFSHLYQRDSSVSMLRVKMARRRSVSQKENRDRAVNRLRRLDQVPELEASVLLDESVVKPATGANEGTAPGQKQAKNDHSSAVEERKKMLARYKEAKQQQKDKERRDKEKKGGVFKVGLYKPQSLNILPQISSALSRAKTSAAAPSLRVTRSMKQQPQVQKPQTQREAFSAPKKVEPAVVRALLSRVVTKPQTTSGRGKAAPVEAAVRPSTTRATSRSQAASVTAPRKPAPDTAADVPKTRATNRQLAVPPVNRGKPAQGKGAARTKTRVQKLAEVEEMDTSPADVRPQGEQAMMEEQEAESEEQEMEAQTLPVLPSFAPQGFVFQAPSGLKNFQSVPLTPRTADAFLTPSVPPAAPLSLTGPQEPQHNVLYFRSVLVSETERLSVLCEQWDGRTEDPSIPDDTRDRMRTAVGQARLLVKERFGQFLGLVDDCDLGRGEKLTTCTDLQGFWDMVFFQVEDVIRKFDALKEAESRGWQEEHKPPPRPKKAVKKPAATAGKAGSRAEAGVAARSRLAAVKAAMRAKQEAEAARAPTENESDPERPAEADAAAAQTVVFQGGFFHVESPLRVSGPLRRSSRMSAASPRPGSNFTTPAKRRPSRSSAAHPSPLPPLSLPPRGQPDSAPVCTPLPLPQDRSSPAQPALPTDLETSPSDQSECDSRLGSSAPPAQEEPLAAAADDQSGRTGAHSQAPEAANSQSQTPERQAQAIGQSKLVPEVTEPTESSTDGSSPPRQAVAADTAGQGVSLTLSPFCPLHSHTPAACHTDSPAVSSDAHMAETPDSSYVENVPGLDFERYLRPALSCSPSLQAEAIAVGASSPLARPTSTDVQMDSPGPDPERGAEGDLLAHAAPVLAQTPVQLAALGHTFSPQMEKLGESELLLFTPELRDQVRQSVCERDLMVFTPPCNR